ncbi:MAG: CdaR family protein [Acidobacteriota bacterium]
MAYAPFRNLGLKFLSISIALLLWMVTASDRTAERSLRVPLEFQNLPQGIEIVGDTPDTIEARIRGRSGVLSRIGASDLSAVIDLRTARPGQRLFHITPAHVSVPYGLEVVQVSPSTLPVSFETSGVRVVPIQPAVDGQPAPGFEVVQVTVEPATVAVVGPESALRRLREAITEPVSVENASRVIRETVTVGVADPSLRLRSPQSAVVTVAIAAASFERTIRGVGVRARNLGAGLRAEARPSQVAVTLRGGEGRLAAVTAADVDLFVDLAGLRPGEYTLPVRTAPLDHFAVSAVTPATVIVRITGS